MPGWNIRRKWPRHFYHANDGSGKLKCLVDDCPLHGNSDLNGRLNGNSRDFLHASMMKQHWDSNHAVAAKILEQFQCVYCDFLCPDFFSQDQLFRHELEVHGTTNMSRIQTFVRLIRQGFIRGPMFQYSVYWVHCRMLEEVSKLPILGEIFTQKCGLDAPAQGYEPWILMSETLCKDRMRPEDEDAALNAELDDACWWIRLCTPLAGEVICTHLVDVTDTDEWKGKIHHLQELYAQGVI